MVPDTLFDIRHDSISVKVIYHTLYNVSVVHMCSGQDIIPLCIGLYYCESQQVYMMDIIMCLFTPGPANCSGDVLGVSSLTVLDCRNSQVLHTIENTDNSCSGVVTQVEHNTTTGPGMYDCDYQSHFHLCHSLILVKGISSYQHSVLLLYRTLLYTSVFLVTNLQLHASILYSITKKSLQYSLISYL